MNSYTYTEDGHIWTNIGLPELHLSGSNCICTSRCFVLETDEPFEAPVVTECSPLAAHRPD